MGRTDGPAEVKKSKSPSAAGRGRCDGGRGSEEGKKSCSVVRVVAVLAVAGREEERWARRGDCCCCHEGGGFEWNGMRCEGGKRNEDRPTDTRTDPSRVSVNVKIEKGYCKHRSCKECSGNWKCRLMKKNHNGLTVDFIIMNHCRRCDQ